MTLTKAQIADSIQKQVELTGKRNAEVLETLLNIMKRTLSNGQDILISGFGKFCVKGKKARRGRNPATGEDMTLGKRRVVTFKCSSALRDKVNT